MTDVFICADNIISPIGSTSEENFGQVVAGGTGIQQHENRSISDVPFFASIFGQSLPVEDDLHSFTKFEQLLVSSIGAVLKSTAVKAMDERTVLVLSSTKGNISLLEADTDPAALPERIALGYSAQLIADHFGFVNEPVVVSNACISGMLALITGMRMIQSGQYDHAVVAGADVISKFILSGFQSFQAVSNEACKPFDEARSGINLGEAAATIVLSSNRSYSNGIAITGGAVSNDANHISGPSRTGEELAQAIAVAMQQAGVNADDITMLCAHGTATLYNDEMEAKAFTIAGLNNVPVNSLKGYFGHTLGAAGLVESIISVHSMKESLLLPTRGFSTLGVTQPIRVCDKLQTKELTNCLKTASGFGGCNAAIIFKKH